MNFFELVNKRESCRAYTEQPVEQEKLMSCIEAARLAPSACNSQPWRFVLVNEQEKVTALAHLLQDKITGLNKFAYDAPAFIVVVEGVAKLSASLGGKVKDQHYAAIDLGIATEHICLAATEQGIGTCIMGWFDEKAIKKLFNIPVGRRVRLVIAFGYSKYPEARKKARKEMQEIVSFNKWGEIE